MHDQRLSSAPSALESSLGVKPRKVAKHCPERNRRISPTMAMSAVAVWTKEMSVAADTTLGPHEIQVAGSKVIRTSSPSRPTRRIISPLLYTHGPLLRRPPRSV